MSEPEHVRKAPLEAQTTEQRADFENIDMGGLLTEGLVESPIAFSAYSVLEVLAGAPAITAMVAVSLCAATSLSGWVLYRNLITTRTVDGNYARASI